MQLWSTGEEYDGGWKNNLQQGQGKHRWSLVMIMMIMMILMVIMIVNMIMIVITARENIGGHHDGHGNQYDYDSNGLHDDHNQGQDRLSELSRWSWCLWMWLWLWKWSWLWWLKKIMVLVMMIMTKDDFMKTCRYENLHKKQPNGVYFSFFSVLSRVIMMSPVGTRWEKL